MTWLDLCLGVSHSRDRRKQLLPPQSMANSIYDPCKSSFPLIEPENRAETLRELTHLTQCVCLDGQNRLGCIKAACENQVANPAARSTKRHRINGAFKTSSIKHD